MNEKPLRVVERLPTGPNREKWGPGRWDMEPDLIEWRDEATGYPCLVVRNLMGSLCGYVGVPPGHPLYGVEYNDDASPGVRVHGGLTYSNACAGDVCHAALPGEPEHVWWFGFDCGHAFDESPGLNLILPPQFWGRAAYRDVEYVRREVASLAAQLHPEAG